VSAALRLAAAASAVCATACGWDSGGCIASCVVPIAVVLTVADQARGGPVAGVSVQASGPTMGEPKCEAGDTASRCTVFGSAGAYTLVVTAPGFTSARFVLDVGGHAAKNECECATVETRTLSVTLWPA
jgi:hypothetical protein